MTRKIVRLLASKYKNDTAKKREKMGAASGIFGIVINIMLCVTKFVLGSITCSVSITADAINNLSDAGTSVVTIAGAKLSAKPLDKEHPFGHGRIEYVSGLAVAFLIFLMGFELGKSALEKIINPEKISFSIIYLIIFIIAICAKLWMSYFNKMIFEETGNLGVKAVMKDSLNDCIATAATMLTLIISHFTGFYRIDGIVGLAVSIFIFYQGIETVKEILGPLLGQPPSPELVKEIERVMMEKDEIVGVHDLIVHDYGPGRIIASVHAEVPCDCDIVSIHEVIDAVERELSSKLNIAICIHMDPIDTNNEQVNKLKQLSREIIKNYDSSFNFHDFRMVNGKENINLIFDLVIPLDCKKKNIEILNDIQKLFKEKDKRLNVVITIEHSYVD